MFQPIADGVDVRGVAADDPVALEPVDPAFDRGRRERQPARRCPETNAGRSPAAAQRSDGRFHPFEALERGADARNRGCRSSPTRESLAELRSAVDPELRSAVDPRGEERDAARDRRPPDARRGRTTIEMPLLGIDHVELYVGNAAQAAYWFTHALGFRETAYAGLETGMRDRSSHVLEQGRVRFVLTAPLLGTSEIARHVAAHGDGVRTIALSVPDAEHAYRYAVQHGAPRCPRAVGGIQRRRQRQDGDGRHLRRDPAHVHRAQRLRGRRSCPASSRLRSRRPREPGMFAGIDHVVGNVELGRLDEWVGYYERVFGMTEMIHFTRRGHRHRVLGADVEGDGRRQGPGQVPDQRARRGPAQVADRGVPRVLRGPGRPAHRPGDDRHRRHRRGAQAPRGPLPRRHPTATTRSSRGGSARSTRISPTCANWGSSPTATTRATCCRSSPRRSATGRPCSWR